MLAYMGLLEAVWYLHYLFLTSSLGGNLFTEKGKAQLRQAVKDRGPNCVKLSLSLSFY